MAQSVHNITKSVFLEHAKRVPFRRQAISLALRGTRFVTSYQTNFPDEPNEPFRVEC